MNNPDFVHLSSAKALIAYLGGRGGKVLCPNHDDKNPSCHIKDGRDGRILAWCFVCCTDLTQAFIDKHQISLFPSDVPFHPKNIKKVRREDDETWQQIKKALAEYIGLTDDEAQTKARRAISAMQQYNDIGWQKNETQTRPPPKKT